MSPLERCLSSPDLRAVDLVDPGLLWGVEWIVDPAAPLHRAGPTADLRRLLDVGSSALDRAVGASREIARLSAVVAGSLATFARCRPGSLLDRPAGERGAMSAATRAARPAALTEVSEWAVDEVALALRIPGRAAESRLTEAVVLVERLPGTLALLARGELGPAHARKMVDVVAPVEDDTLRGEIEAHVLGLLGEKTPPQLADCARRIVLREDADAAARTLVVAVRERGVRLHDRRDGTGTVALDLPLPTAAAIYRSLEAVAEQARVDGDQRTKQQRMADCVADLVLRPGENGLPPVTVALTLVATLETMLGGSEPGQVEGMLVSAEMVRELGYTFGLMPRPAPDLAGLPDGVVDPALSEQETPEAPAGPRRRRTVRSPKGWRWSGHGPTPRPVRPSAGPGKPSATERGPTGKYATCSTSVHCWPLGTWPEPAWPTARASRSPIGCAAASSRSPMPPPSAPGRPSARRRGGRATPPAPNSTASSGSAISAAAFRAAEPAPAAAISTTAASGRTGPRRTPTCACLCEHHHRLRHQAPGWRVEEAPGGALAVTTPGGQVLVSHPPRFGTDLDVPP